MKNYAHLREICEQNSEISRKTVDEFLLYYIALRENLDKEVNRHFSAFKHVTQQFEQSWVNMLKAQYIAHRIFRANGLVHKYIQHPKFKERDEEEQRYIHQQARHPWRFSFARIMFCPDKDFYTMEDAFTGEEYLLYSPGITHLVGSQSITLCFNLIGYNGLCWQSYGPIAAYKAFEADDIFFFATEWRAAIENDDELVADVEKNPVPYMMLLSGANYPLTFHKKEQVVQAIAQYELNSFHTQGLEKHFKIAYNKKVYQLTLKRWGDYPHFARAYYDEVNKIMFLVSCTDRSFYKLTERLNECGFDVREESDIRVNVPIIVTTENILQKKINLNPYASLFEKDISPDEQNEMDKINAFMAMILPDINAGREPDIETMAKKAGVDVQVAHDIVQHAMDKLKNL